MAAALVGLLILLSIVGPLVALREFSHRSLAEQQLSNTNSLRLALESQQIQVTFPQRSILLAMEAVNLTNKPSISAHQALRDSLRHIGGRPIVGHEGPITHCIIDPKGRWLVIGSMDKTARLWDLTADDPAAECVYLFGRRGGINSVAIDPKGRWLVTAGRRDNTARLWDLMADDFAAECVLLPGHDGGINSVAIDQQGRWLVTAGGRDKTARLWDLTADNPAAGCVVLREHEGQISRVVIGPKDRWLVMIRTNNPPRLWDLQIENLARRARQLAGRELTAEELKMYILEPMEMHQ